jgi:7-cyano-7-deazaguanine reductase
MTDHFGDNPLGRASRYDHGHDAGLLHPVERAGARAELGIDDSVLPFRGRDDWNAWELSWLNGRGKPEVALAEWSIPCDSPCLIESKSLKLYLNGLANTVFSGGFEAVTNTLERDLSACAGAGVRVRLWTLAEAAKQPAYPFAGVCLDDLDIAVQDYELKPALLEPASGQASEILYTHLLRSLCPVTGQPDWASVIIDYEGAAIPREGLLRYLVSFRNHSGFHEQVVERIFTDLQRQYDLQRLTVQARFTRRGGLDINPVRSTHYELPDNRRTVRQ